jgi:type II secretory pathway pseudopilin PulG
MRSRVHHVNNEKGFTYIELIMVMVVIFVLAIAVTYRLTSTSTLSVAAAADQVESYIRYTQASAMSRQVTVSIALAADAGGWYFTVGNQNYHIPQGVSLSLSGSITFNSLGEPIPPIGTVTVGSTSITVVQTTGKVTRS